METQNTRYKSTINYCLLFIFTISYYLFPELLFATTETTKIGGDNSNAIAIVICNVVKQLTGSIGQALSTVAVIFIGIGLFMGKISWGLALGIAVGIAMLFGAESVVTWISGAKFACQEGTL